MIDISVGFISSSAPILTVVLPRCVPAVKLNGNRTVQGTLRGFDQFMNLVIDEAVEQAPPPPHLARAPPACTPFKHAHARAPA